jgi:hypothetical protein
VVSSSRDLRPGCREEVSCPPTRPAPGRGDGHGRPPRATHPLSPALTWRRRRPDAPEIAAASGVSKPPAHQIAGATPCRLPDRASPGSADPLPPGGDDAQGRSGSSSLVFASSRARGIPCLLPEAVAKRQCREEPGFASPGLMAACLRSWLSVPTFEGDYRTRIRVCPGRREFPSLFHRWPRISSITIRSPSHQRGRHRRSSWGRSSALRSAWGI